MSIFIVTLCFSIYSIAVTLWISRAIRKVNKHLDLHVEETEKRWRRVENLVSNVDNLCKDRTKAIVATTEPRKPAGKDGNNA